MGPPLEEDLEKEFELNNPESLVNRGITGINEKNFSFLLL